MYAKILFIIFYILIFVNPSFASNENFAAQLFSSEGSVFIMNKKTNQWQKVGEKQKFLNGDVLYVGKEGRAAVKFKDGTLVRFSKNSVVTFDESEGEKKLALNLNKGILHLFSRNSRKHPIVKTQDMVAAIHGTEFVIEVKPEETKTTIISGIVEGSNNHGSVIAHSSEQILANKDKAPRKILIMDPYKAAQWAFYYPRVIDLSDYSSFFVTNDQSELKAWEEIQNGDYTLAAKVVGDSWQARMERSIAAWYNNDFDKALKEVADNNVFSPAYFLYRSSLELALGDVEASEKSMALAESREKSLDSSNLGKLKASIYAQRSIIALTNNNMDEAKRMLIKSKAEAPQSSPYLLAESYYNQASLDLDKAKKNVEVMQKNITNSSIGNLRLAELELGFDNRDKASEYLDKALLSNPHSAMAYAMKGFIALQENNADKALKYFNESLSYDNELPLAYLGKGLTLIYNEEAEAGRKELEKAVHLAPNVALYRSYLGKAFLKMVKRN